MRFIKKKTYSSKSKTDLLKHPLNLWIQQDKILSRFFKHIISELHHADFERLTKDRDLVFLNCLGHYSATLPTDKNLNIVLIFPNLINEIYKANNSMAYAIIFHELGHIYHKHFESKNEDILKQIEADAFAIKYGYGHELLEFLSQYNNEESHIRSNEVLKLTN